MIAMIMALDNKNLQWIELIGRINFCGLENHKNHKNLYTMKICMCARYVNTYGLLHDQTKYVISVGYDIRFDALTIFNQ